MSTPAYYQYVQTKWILKLVYWAGSWEWNGSWEEFNLLRAKLNFWLKLWKNIYFPHYVKCSIRQYVLCFLYFIYEEKFFSFPPPRPREKTHKKCVILKNIYKEMRSCPLASGNLTLVYVTLYIDLGKASQICFTEPVDKLSVKYPPLLVTQHDPLA